MMTFEQTITMKEVIALTGYDRQKIWRLQNTDNYPTNAFPKAIRRGEHLLSDIIEWQNKMKATPTDSEMELRIKESNRLADEALLAHLILQIATVRNRMAA